MFWFVVFGSFLGADVAQSAFGCCERGISLLRADHSEPRPGIAAGCFDGSLSVADPIAWGSRRTRLLL
jgi:hypothetical protein